MSDPSRRTPEPLRRLDRLHARMRSSALLYRFTLATRFLLATAFIPTGLVKVLGQRFTNMPPTSELGLFFEVMYQSGPFWRFAGAAQVIAGMLMLIPRTAALGAVLFTPVIASIFVITLSFDFRGTPVVTGMMLLATLYLLAWDWHRLRPLLTVAPPAALALPEHRLTAAERTVYAVGVAAALAAFLGVRSLLPAAFVGVGMVLAVVAALAGAAAFAVTHLRSRGVSAPRA
jgi:hypothetical protein